MITLNKAIYSLINSAVSGYTSNIYPLILPENCTFPAIIFERNTNQINYTKDYLTDFENTVTITILTENYSDGILIAETLQNSLNMFRGLNNGINIISLKLVDIAENYDTDVYQQKLTYIVKCR